MVYYAPIIIIKGDNAMHCIEIKSSDLGNFKARILRLGGQVSIVSRYTERSIRLLDVEVSIDNKAVDKIEKQFVYAGV